MVDGTNQEIRVLDSLGKLKNRRDLGHTVSKILTLFIFLPDRYFTFFYYLLCGLLDNWPTETHRHCSKTESHTNKMEGPSSSRLASA